MRDSFLRLGKILVTAALLGSVAVGAGIFAGEALEHRKLNQLAVAVVAQTVADIHALVEGPQVVARQAKGDRLPVRQSAALDECGCGHDEPAPAPMASR